MQVFGHSLEMKMQKILNFLLKELGCNISEARAIVLSQPHVFSYSREKNLLPKVLMDQWVSPCMRRWDEVIRSRSHFVADCSLLGRSSTSGRSAFRQGRSFAS